MFKHALKHAMQIICLVAGLLLPAGPAVPQAPSPEAVAAARELVSVMRLDEQMKAIMPTVLLSMKSALSRGNPLIERDYDAALPAILDAINARMKDFIELQAAIYARNFSPDELKELTEFYRQPIGQKLVNRTPEIARQSMAAGQAFGAQIGAEMQQRMIQELRKKGHAI